MAMTQARNEYAETLTEKRILYMPSCVIVEMMTKLYSEIFAISQAGALNSTVPVILERMDEMRTNLRVTAEAYGRSNIRFFIGDWREDKLRARRMFFNIMSHLGYITGMVGRTERDKIYGAIEGMTAEWIGLDRAMDAKATKKNGHTICRYFRNRKPESWKQTMANIILTLDEDSDYSEGDYLVLLCFERIKKLLVGTIEGIERRKGTPGRFNPDKILVVSDEDVAFSCPTCLEMTDSIGTQVVDEDYPSATFADAILAMQGASCPMRPRPRHIKREDMAAATDKPLPKPKKHTTMQWLRAALGAGKL